MAQYTADRSLLPLDVGFDLRVVDNEIIIDDGRGAWTYLDGDEIRTIRGYPHETIPVLRAAGYRCTYRIPPPQRVIDPPCPEHGQTCK